MSDLQSYFNQSNGDGLGSPLPATTPVSDQTQPSQVAPQEPAQGDEPVTIAKLKEILSQHDREIQSRTDKVLSSQDKRYSEAMKSVAQQMEELKKVGIPVTTEQELALKNYRLNEAMNVSGPTASGQPTNPTNPIFELVGAEVDGIVRANNLTPADAQLIYQAIPKGLTPLKFINEFEKRAAEKKAGDVNRAASSLPGSAQGSAVSGSDALNAQLKVELDQIQHETHPSIKRGDTNAISALVASYRQKGAIPQPPAYNFGKGLKK